MVAARQPAVDQPLGTRALVDPAIEEQSPELRAEWRPKVGGDLLEESLRASIGGAHGRIDKLRPNPRRPGPVDVDDEAGLTSHVPRGRCDLAPRLPAARCRRCRRAGLTFVQYPFGKDHSRLRQEKTGSPLAEAGRLFAAHS